MTFSDFKPSLSGNVFSLNDVLLKQVYGEEKYIIRMQNIVGYSPTLQVIVNEIINPTIYLYRGKTYRFIQSDSSNSGYQIGIDGDQTGWTYSGTAGVNGQATYTVPLDAPDNKIYSYPSGSSGNIVIQDLPQEWPRIDQNYRKVNYGYFLGGSSQLSGVIGDVDKINYVTNTANQVVTYLNQYRQDSSSAGNITNGYIIGGEVLTPSSNLHLPSSLYSSIEKLNYSTETISLVPGANLPQSSTRTESVGDPSGDIRIFGGVKNDSSNSFISSQYKIRTSDDTVHHLSNGNMPQGLIDVAGASSPQNTESIFISGGIQDSTNNISTLYDDNIHFGKKFISDISKVNVSSDTVSPSGYLTIFGHEVDVGRPFLIGVGGEKFVYFGSPGGSLEEFARFLSIYAPAPQGASCYYVDRFDVSTETKTRSLTSLPISFHNDATGHSTAGYFGGGSTDYEGSSESSSIHRLDYITDTSMTSSQLCLGSKRIKLTALSPHEDYWTTSETGTSKIIPNLELTFSSSSSSAPDVGYFVGGHTKFTYNESDHMSSGLIEKYDFSNDTLNILPFCELNFGRTYLTSVGNSQYGYFCGGNSSRDAILFSINRRTAHDEFAAISSIEKFSYAFDTISYLQNSSLPEPIQRACSIGNQTNGYVIGGTYESTYINEPYSGALGAPIKSYISKLRFNNDSVSRVGTNLLDARESAGSVGNMTSGYVMGGLTHIASIFSYSSGWPSNYEPQASSSVEKFDYSVETFFPVSNTLTQPKYKICSVGDSTHGYIIGGVKINSSPANVTAVTDSQKITYSTDTISTIPSAPSSFQVRSATGNSTNAIFSIYMSSYSSEMLYFGGSYGHNNPIAVTPLIPDKFLLYEYSSTTFSLSTQGAKVATIRIYDTGISPHQNGLPGTFYSSSSTIL